MGANTDTLKQGYEAYGRGDIDAAMENWNDDIQWENPNAQQLPYPGVTRGKDDVRKLLEEFPTYWERVEVSPDEFIEDGDTVVVLGHVEATGKETGREVKYPFVHIWRFSDGTVNRMQNLFDTALAAEALGRL
jgi:ketosteroid isomerase-like protein